MLLSVHVQHGKYQSSVLHLTCGCVPLTSLVMVNGSLEIDVWTSMLAAIWSRVMYKPRSEA